MSAMDATPAAQRRAVDVLETARADLAAGRWQAAVSSFQAALADFETPEALEGLSWAAWWLDDAAAVLDARERAFRRYRTSGQPAAAARMAIWIATDQLDFQGAFAVATGWLRHAARLLDGLAPGPEHGWLAFNEGYFAYLRGDTTTVLERAAHVTELGRRLDVADLEMLGLALNGTALVACADVERGMELLDEATVVVLSGEATVPIAGAWACCFLVAACELVRDYTRAFEWCDRIDAFARRYGSRYMLGFCRSHYGWLYLCGGRWQEAESALAQAVDAYRASRPTFVPQAIVALAELRRRQGRWQDAERLLDEAGTGGPALLCRARLALDRGEALRAAELAERTLRRVPEHQRLERVPGLELLVRAHAVRGDVASAAAPLQELRSLEQLVPVPSLRALVLLMDGLISAATGDHDAAVRELQDAADQLEQCGAPFEASQARLELARSMIAVGRAEAASQEATIALKRLRQLGADAESRRAQSLLEAATHGVRSARPLPQLTRRERDVLRLVAQGLTNRQIAEQLVVSEHTIHRHITNLLRKLNLPGRTAAATHAALAGLLDTAP